MLQWNHILRGECLSQQQGRMTAKLRHFGSSDPKGQGEDQATCTSESTRVKLESNI